MYKILNDLFYEKDGVIFWKIKNKQAGTDDGRGYILIRFTVNKKKYRLKSHQIVFCLHHKYIPKIIDHIDKNKSNNKIENLREASHQINMINRDKTKANTSGVCGVSRHSNKRGWFAQISYNKKHYHLGYFNNFEDAVSARKQAEKVFYKNLFQGELS